jgi:hypothetical protein
MYYKINNKIYDISKLDVETECIYKIRVNWVINKSIDKNINKSNIQSIDKNINQSKYIYNMLMYDCNYKEFEIDDIETIEAIKVYRGQ